MRSHRWFVRMGLRRNLIRKIEMALLDLKADTNSFDVLAATDTVRLSASKSDARGLTAARTKHGKFDKFFAALEMG